MNRVPDEPLETADRVRSVFRGKPSFSDESISRILQKHGFAAVQTCEARSSYAPNVVMHVECEDSRQLAVKVQVLTTWDWTLTQEALTLDVLTRSTDLLLPEFWILDQDRDVLGYPVLILDWLPGPSAADEYDAADSDRRRGLARQLGLIHGSIHACPCHGLALPELDLREWRQLVHSFLFGHQQLRDDLRARFPDIERDVRSSLDKVEDFIVSDDLCLIWRDGKFHNTVVVDGDESFRLGAFDFQSAAIGQTYPDCFKARASIGADSPEWDHFVDGYTSVTDRRPTEPDSQTARAFRMYSNAYQIRHFYELAGCLHYRTPKWLNGLFEALEKEGALA